MMDPIPRSEIVVARHIRGLVSSNKRVEIVGVVELSAEDIVAVQELVGSSELQRR